MLQRKELHTVHRDIKGSRLHRAKAIKTCLECITWLLLELYPHGNAFGVLVDANIDENLGSLGVCGC